MTAGGIALPPAPSYETRPTSGHACLQLWILLAVATLSALPWMVVEFKKAHYSVHYQGTHLTGAAVCSCWSACACLACQWSALLLRLLCSMVHCGHFCDPGRVCVDLRGEGCREERSWGCTMVLVCSLLPPAARQAARLLQGRMGTAFACS